jgi:hypothetical protein
MRVQCDLTLASGNGCAPAEKSQFGIKSILDSKGDRPPTDQFQDRMRAGTLQTNGMPFWPQTVASLRKNSFNFNAHDPTLAKSATVPMQSDPSLHHLGLCRARKHPHSKRRNHIIHRHRHLCRRLFLVHGKTLR